MNIRVMAKSGAWLEPDYVRTHRTMLGNLDFLLWTAANAYRV